MKSRITPTPRGAFSLTEMLVTILIIGVLAAIAIPVYSNITETSRRTVVQDHVEALNRAVTNFGHACWKFPTAANDSATTDEMAVVRSLQWKFPASSLKLGSPYFDPRYDPAGTSSTSEYRIRWNGKGFEMLDKGQAGSGLKYDGSSDYKPAPYTFPSGYTPVGP